MILGLLAEKQFGRIRLFVNGENLTGVRQTRWDPLLLPTRASTAAGPSTRGHRSKAGTSMAACGFVSGNPLRHRFTPLVSC